MKTYRLTETTPLKGIRVIKFHDITTCDDIGVTLEDGEIKSVNFLGRRFNYADAPAAVQSVAVQVVATADKELEVAAARRAVAADNCEVKRMCRRLIADR